MRGERGGKLLMEKEEGCRGNGHINKSTCNVENKIVSVSDNIPAVRAVLLMTRF